jgi:cell division GTPase FtsZ
VIFGAVTDDQIRKGDIHITVIATGFDTNKVNEASEKISKAFSGATIPVETKKKEEPKEERIIFPTKKLETKMIIEEKIQPRGISMRGETSKEAEEEELEIPAFIRRKMEK